MARACKRRRVATAADDVARYGTYVESGESIRTSGEFLNTAGWTRKRATPARASRASIVSMGTKPLGSAFQGGSTNELGRSAGPQRNICATQSNSSSQCWYPTRPCSPGGRAVSSEPSAQTVDDGKIDVSAGWDRAAP